jgi:hypothetical protein
MPQHIWQPFGGVHRICDACEVRQVKISGSWQPEVSSICPGDDRDSSNRKRPRPSSDAPKVKVLEA